MIPNKVEIYKVRMNNGSVFFTDRDVFLKVDDEYFWKQIPVIGALNLMVPAENIKSCTLLAKLFDDVVLTVGSERLTE